MARRIRGTQNYPGWPAISRGEIHVWIFRLNVPWCRANHLESSLSSEEKARSNLFRSGIDRLRFVRAHGITRTILGRYVDIEPSCLRFAFNDYGKPMLLEQTDFYQLHFNLSHSYELALLAVARERQVGIDVELRRAMKLDDVLVPEMFSQREVLALKQLPASKRSQAFYACWTQKEAFVKATGYGLSFPCQMPEFASVPAQSKSLVTMPWGRNEVRRWCMCPLNIAKEYSGALAAEGHDWRVRYLAYKGQQWSV